MEFYGRYFYFDDTFVKLSSSGSANPPLDIPFEYWIVPSDPFMSCLDSLLGCSTGEFQALQLIVLAVFGAVDEPLASCMLFHFLEI